MADDNLEMDEVIEVMIDNKIAQIIQPMKVLITKKYDDGHVDVKTLSEEEITYVAYVGSPTVNKYGILIFLETGEHMVIG